MYFSEKKKNFLKWYEELKRVLKKLSFNLNFFNAFVFVNFCTEDFIKVSNDLFLEFRVYFLAYSLPPFLEKRGRQEGSEEK